MEKWTFKLGAHPINWVGEDVEEHGADTSYEQILDDMQALGLKGTEMGRKYPRDPAVLRRELDSRGIQLVSQWKSVQFSDPSRRAAELEAYRRHADFLAGFGSKVISTCETGGSFFADALGEGGAGGAPLPRGLDDEGWKHLAEGLNEAGRIAQSFGLKLAYHHHAGTAVERPHEIERLMETTDRNLVYLLFDTGHALYGGADPLELLRTYSDRVAYVHLKDVRPGVLAAAREEGCDFITCIRRGVFTVPGDGCIDFAPIVQELESRGYQGWAMLEGEQDPATHPPYEYAKRSMEYLYSL